MLTAKEAQRIGFAACAEKIGKETLKENEDTATYAAGIDGRFMACFIGAGETEPTGNEEGKLVLDSTSKFKYAAECRVNMEDGEVVFEE